MTRSNDILSRARHNGRTPQKIVVHTLLSRCITRCMRERPFLNTCDLSELYKSSERSRLLLKKEVSAHAQECAM